jgi:GTP diphosphokinase / guanosine-3',5'-bis(diphosphate) 3'-diphosphatase
MLTPEEQIEIDKRFKDLLNSCPKCRNEEDKKLIEKAYKIAYEAHKDARRRSGEPYIVHPIAVAKIVSAEIGLGVKSVISALLHDVVEDTDLTLEDIDRNFGPKIASIIDGLTKIGDVFDRNSSLQAENFRKMLLTMSEDIRVILIKLGDRLHNMRTLGSMPVNKQIKIAGETAYLYAPLAHRLGLYSIKTELEDLSLKYRYPRAYDDIQELIEKTAPSRNEYITNFIDPIRKKLDEQGFTYDISGRTKSIYSIWNKMQTKNVPFEEIYDLSAIRIVFEPLPNLPEKAQCWNIYTQITDIYPPKPDRIRDWLSQPKANGYEALHVTVMGTGGNWVEVQIRSQRMDEVAERGYAAHWKYKQNYPQETELDKWLKKIREMLASPNSDALEFLDDFKLNLFATEIIIFTPKGKMISLPKDATALDFAYEIHSHIGNKALGAKVNHKLVPLNFKLQSGDQIEIITSDKQHPLHEWLDFVKTMKARTSIKNYFKAETKNRVEKGKRELEEKLHKHNVAPSSRVFKKLLPAYEVSTKEELYSKIGMGIISLDDLGDILKSSSKNKLIHYWKLAFDTITGEAPKIDTKNPYLLRESDENDSISYTIAKCCNPIPGDDVIGYKDLNGNIIIHKTKCPNALRLVSSQGERIVPTKWITHKVSSFLETISIQGIDRFGIFSSIVTLISKDLSVNIRNVQLSSHDGIFEGNFDIYVHNLEDLNTMIENLLKIRGLEQAARVEKLEE